MRKIVLKEKGVSTLKPRNIWFDPTVRRLNLDGRGDLVGAFSGDDRLLLVSGNGKTRTVVPELNMHFEDDIHIMEKWIPKNP